MTATGIMEFQRLTRQHGVKIQCSASVEECSLAIGDVVGHENVKSASRMNNAIVVFISTVDKARQVIATGIVLNDAHTTVLPLSSPSKKVIISNVPPFINDNLIEDKLSGYGRLVSSIRKISLGCKSTLLKHVVSFRRQVYMVLDNGEEELNLTIKLNVDGFEYTVYATTDALLRCFHCGCVGHVVRDCPRKKNNSAESAPKVAETSSEGPPATPPSPAEAFAHEASTPNISSKSEEHLIDLITKGLVAAAGGSTPAGSNDSAVNLITKELTALSEKDGRPVLETPTVNVNAEVSGLLSPEPAQDVAMSGGFKTPFKRKAEDSASCVPRAKKGDEHDSDEESVCSNLSDSSIGDVCAPGGDLPLKYKAEDISRFLYETKGLRNVETELYFPDRQQFINDVVCFLRDNVFSGKEAARLRKFLTKLRKKVKEQSTFTNSTHP